jgi:hypothetical protein
MKAVLASRELKVLPGTVRNIMKISIQVRTLRALSMAAGLLLGAANLPAQDGPPPGNFDPAQMRQRMIERIREALDVKDDAEWQIISERITKVMDARRGARGPGGMAGFGPPPGGPPPQGSNGPGPGNAGPGPAGAGEFRGPPPGGFAAQVSPEAEALRKAIEAKAPTAELKTRLAEFKAARAKKQAELEKAQQDLREVLSVQQEAVAVTFGLL